MSAEKQQRLSPAAKAARTRAAFTRKVELLETWAATGFVESDWFPKTLGEFAAWDDPRLGVEAWRKANIVSDAKHRDLRERYDRAIAGLLLRAGQTRRGGEERRKRDLAERGVSRMAEQLVAERLAHQTTKKDLRLALANNAVRGAAAGRPNLRLVKA